MSQEEKTYSATFLADKLNIPYKYLTKLMTRLVDIGYIVSIRGKCGGFKFAKKLESITIADIINQVDEIDDSICVLGKQKCDEGKKCPLHDTIIDVKTMMAEAFKNTTLADLT